MAIARPRAGGGPRRVRHIGDRAASAPIVDAGCGTGKVGIALRDAGWGGGLIGLDLSGGMLGQAAKSGAYDALIRGSLYDLPFSDDQAAATVSSGVFTLGHVGGEALAELGRRHPARRYRATTQRVDLAEGFAPYSDALCAAGRWAEIERTTPERLHPARDDSEQIVITWRVRPSATEAITSGLQGP